MPDPSAVGIFVSAVLVLTLTPGPAVLYIVTRSVSQGRTAGVVSCLGIGLGGLVHVACAAFGLSALLASSALAFSLVKYAGAAYLIWLGVQKLRSTPSSGPSLADCTRPLERVFWDGVVVNTLNPKTALFFLAFLPQFVDPARGSITPQLFALGALFIVIAFSTDTLWSLGAASAAGWLKRHPGFLGAERYFSGSVYLGLGLATAVSGNGRK